MWNLFSFYYLLFPTLWVVGIIYQSLTVSFHHAPHVAGLSAQIIAFHLLPWFIVLTVFIPNRNYSGTKWQRHIGTKPKDKWTVVPHACPHLTDHCRHSPYRQTRHRDAPRLNALAGQTRFMVFSGFVPLPHCAFVPTWAFIPNKLIRSKNYTNKATVPESAHKFWLLICYCINNFT